MTAFRQGPPPSFIQIPLTDTFNFSSLLSTLCSWLIALSFSFFTVSDSLTDDLFSLLAESRESASARLFVRLLKHSPELHHWLKTAFLDTRTRERLDVYLAGSIKPPENTRNFLSWLAHSDELLIEEQAILKSTLDGGRGRIGARSRAKFGKRAGTGIYGGLTRAQVAQLIRKHQAGNIHLAPFLLTHAWRCASLPDAVLLLASARYCERALARDRPNLARQLGKAAEFYRKKPPGSISRSHYGLSVWWRLSILHYLLNHPKPSYRTGELKQHLASQGIAVDPNDIRRFCQKNGIARDTKPGRPRQNFSESIASLIQRADSLEIRHH